MKSIAAIIGKESFLMAVFGSPVRSETPSVIARMCSGFSTGWRVSEGFVTPPPFSFL